MNSKLWIQKALTMCLLMTIIATYSMVALAGTGSAVGELMVTGGNSASDTSFVTVNGEPAKSGRSVSSSSTITTPEGMTAIVNFGKLGKIEIGPNTTFALNAEDNAISGTLASGSITVLSAAKNVGVTTANGEIVQLNAGETASATPGTGVTKKQTTKASSGDWWIYALIFGGAAAGIIWAATSDNDSNIGGSSTTSSPIR
jgi:hypothetical protein